MQSFGFQAQRVYNFRSRFCRSQRIALGLSVCPMDIFRWNTDCQRHLCTDNTPSPKALGINCRDLRVSIVREGRMMSKRSALLRDGSTVSKLFVSCGCLQSLELMPRHYYMVGLAAEAGFLAALSYRWLVFRLAPPARTQPIETTSMRTAPPQFSSRTIWLIGLRSPLRIYFLLEWKSTLSLTNTLAALQYSCD